MGIPKKCEAESKVEDVLVSLVAELPEHRWKMSCWSRKSKNESHNCHQPKQVRGSELDMCMTWLEMFLVPESRWGD